jgi:hypothetical protein
MSRVDVVVPCYNYARFLPRCVASLLGQRGVDVRVLVIDDASSDDTPEVGRRLAESDPRVAFRRHAANRGHIATYNEGLLDWADGDYALLISADDVLAPGALRRAARLMDRHPEVGMTYGMALVIRDDDAPPDAPLDDPDRHTIVSGERFMAHCFEQAHCPVSTPTAVVRTAAQHAAGGYSADLPHSGDLEMWLRFAARGPIGVFRNVQAYYRWHSRNMGAQYYDRLLGDRREFMMACRRVLERAAGRFPDAARWEEAMVRRVGRDALMSAHRSFDAGEDAAAGAWLAFAEEIDPSVPGSALWLRLRAKQVAGAGVVHGLRDLAARMRGEEAPDEPAVASHFRGFQPGRLVGWWPE